LSFFITNYLLCQKRQKLLYQNFVCESHHEALLNVLNYNNDNNLLN
jgi:hypothetical protein